MNMHTVAEAIGWLVIGMGTIAAVVSLGYVCGLCTAEYVVKWLKLGQVFIRAGHLLRQERAEKKARSKP